MVKLITGKLQTKTSQSSLLCSRNVRWLHCMLPPGESRWVNGVRQSGLPIWPIDLLNKYVYMGRTDRQTHGRQTVTLHLPLDAASVISITRGLCDFTLKERKV